ncbi:MerR family DNA-binding transcriptional regulator, partial [Streptomyces humidus]|uniref:MerR family DNA-binding transcriptional regulator n=1 Tax=Streptomyces humidus TaxID=52259 RepID=UPI003D9EDB11
MSEAMSPDDAGLTTGALARRLGVAPTTLRSWDRRYGIGPAVRADGRHRRWRPSDVAVLEATEPFASLLLACLGQRPNTRWLL